MADEARPVDIRPLGDLPNAEKATVASGQTIRLGDVIALDSSGNAVLADASSATLKEARGIVVSLNNDGAAATVTAGGVVSYVFDGEVIGLAEDLDPTKVIWLSETAGRFTQNFNGGAAANGDLAQNAYPVQIGVPLGLRKMRVDIVIRHTVLTA